jgi:hypothetical protein
MLLQILYTYLPLMNRLFQSAAIGADSWARIMLSGVATYFIVEAEKKCAIIERTNNSMPLLMIGKFSWKNEENKPACFDLKTNP